MTVLEKKKAASGIDTKRGEGAERRVAPKRSGFRTYLVVGLVAAGIGVGAVVGASRLGLVGTDQLSPAQIAEIRAAQLAEQAESLYWAQLAQRQEQRAQDMAEFYSRQHQAWISQINEQRAQDMAEFYSRQHQARIDWIQEQRAQDMVTFQRGWQGEAGS